MVIYRDASDKLASAATNLVPTFLPESSAASLDMHHSYRKWILGDTAEQVKSTFSPSFEKPAPETEAQITARLVAECNLRATVTTGNTGIIYVRPPEIKFINPGSTLPLVNESSFPAMPVSFQATDEPKLEML